MTNLSAKPTQALVVHKSLTCDNSESLAWQIWGCQHMLMEINESFEAFLERVGPKLVRRLIDIEGGDPGDLVERIKMTSRVIKQLESQLTLLIIAGSDDTSRRMALLNEVLRTPPPDNLPTWKEVGEALGVSPQAAHRKYGEMRRRVTAEIPEDG